MYFTYLLNIDIDIDIAILCKYHNRYRIEIESMISKQHYRLDFIAAAKYDEAGREQSYKAPLSAINQHP